ncbi:hypothetical protein [Abyssalbus ytuae]|uniref:Uncharacterized protein n=1 Tax=Abyssalbus ytuae TaxID=2926907 RepID=A0A9E7A0L8_9FLAO|nr:hypothetical protein [Abyssalbus ytuae]UOB17511.1 hypothetical protein MQE35_17460 [Abyssalbus ytuae]
MIALEFIKSELKNHNLELKPKNDGREGVDFFIENYQIYIQTLDLDTIKQSVKISKQDLGELKDNLFIALVLIIDREPRVVYLVPSKQLSQVDSNVFRENEVTLMPSLSNWEIRVSSNTIPKLAKYSLENMIKEL